MQEKRTGVVKLTAHDPRTIEQLIRFMHTGQLDNLTPDDDAKIYLMADFFNVKQFWVSVFF
jgi:hypothetical protein